MIGAGDGGAPDAAIVHQSPFAHPELDHAIQCAAVDVELTAEFVQIKRALCVFDRV